MNGPRSNNYVLIENYYELVVTFSTQLTTLVFLNKMFLLYYYLQPKPAN